MAGDAYNPDMHSVPQPEAAETLSEERPALDQSFSQPPGISDLQDALIGDAVVPGGRAFVRVVSDNGQRDEPDPGA